jgi:hypothetical protein
MATARTLSLKYLTFDCQHRKALAPKDESLDLKSCSIGCGLRIQAYAPKRAA